MYRPMVAFESMRATPVAGRRNKGLNIGNVVSNSKVTGDGDHIDGGGIEIKLKCWHCGREHLKRNFPKRTKKKQKTKRTTAAPTINALTEGKVKG